MFFCIKIVLDTSPSIEYILLDMHGPFLEVESQTKQTIHELGWEPWRKKELIVHQNMDQWTYLY